MTSRNLFFCLGFFLLFFAVAPVLADTQEIFGVKQL